MSEMLTMPYWEDLAKQAQVRLPYPTSSLTTARVTKFLHQLGLNRTAFTRWMGFSTLEQALTANSWCTCREFCGVVLEYWLELQQASQPRVVA